MLDEITSRKDSQTQQLQSSLDQPGRVRITRQRIPYEHRRTQVQLVAHGGIEDEEQGVPQKP
jgi:hypothetical protein